MLSLVILSTKNLYLEDELKIRSFVKSITKTSFFMSQFISRDDELIVEAKVHLVFVDKNGKPIKVPEYFLKILNLIFAIL